MKEPQKGFKELLAEIILPKVEMISIAILVIAILFKYLETKGYPELISISLTTLAVTNYLIAFSPTQGETSLTFIITQKIGFISCSIAIVGIMFTELSLPGNTTMLAIGGVTVGLACLSTGVLYFQKNSAIVRKMLIRFLVVFVTTLMTYLPLITTST